MEQIIGATLTTVASASPHDTAPVTVAYSPVVDADTALVSVPIQIPDPFWTSCDQCGFQFEYEFKYQDLLIKCPWCSNPFVAKERSTNYEGARNENAAQGEYLEMLPKRQGIQKEASRGDVIAELKKIPDLERDDFHKAFDILSCDDFQYRMLVAFPMHLKRPWLLKEIRKQMK